MSATAVCKRIFVLRVMLACTTALLFSQPAHSQSNTATLSGSVIDESAAVISGVTIVLLNVDTALKRETTTTDRGYFSVPLLPPGRYTLRAQLNGFGPIQMDNIVLNVNDQVAVSIRMKVAPIGEEVTVIAEPSRINTSPAVATIIDRGFVSNLPLNGRSFQSLIAMVPGVVQTKASADNPGQFSINGQRANANYFTVDGVSANIGTTATINVSQTLAGSLPGFTAQGGTSSLVSIEALQEFQVQTSTYAPEFGRTPGGQISFQTRSGTNAFHGSLFNYFRNDALDANDWFGNRGGLEKPALRQNNFGGVFGGPIILPGYNGRDKTFFFLSYERLRLRQPQVVLNAEVPSLALRQTAPPQMRPYLNAFPLPTGADLGNGLAQFSSSFSNPSTLDARSIRIDHMLGAGLRVFGRYNGAPSETISRGTGSGLSSPTVSIRDTKTMTGGATLSRGLLLNELRLNYSNVTGRSFNTIDTFGGAEPLSPAEVFPPFAPREDSFFGLSLNFAGRPTISLGPTAASEQRQINLVNTVAIVRGQHQLKFGVDYRRLSPVFGPAPYAQIMFFNDAAAINSATTSIGFVSARQAARPLFSNVSVFGQDTWRAGRRLTLTYGVRWELNPPPHGADGNDAYTATGLDNLATSTLAPRGTPLYKTTYTNFAPRLGGAYELSQRHGFETVLRGGAGIFYDLGTGQTAQGFATAPFSTGNKIITNISFPTSSAEATPLPFPSPPFPLVNAVDPNLKLPLSYQWNVSVQQALGSRQSVTGSHVGAIGRRLVSVHSVANPNAMFANLNIVSNRGTSDYHALQVQFERRLSQGLQSLVSYTWAHSTDDASSDFGIDLDRGPSDFDVRHSFSGAVSYDIPAPARGPVWVLFRDWTVDAITRAQSGPPVNVIARTTFNLAGTVVNVRPDVIEGIPFYLDDPTAPGGRRFNNTVDPSRPGCKGPFCIPPANRQGTLPRNALRAFPFTQVDLSLRRQFRSSEHLNFQARAEVFNLLNHPNFGDPDNRLTASTFGEARTMYGRSLGGVSPLYQVGGSRSVQLSLKLQF
jgi:hypothetical protein